MSSKVLFTPLATEDLNQIWLYIALESNVEVADRFVDQIREKCLRISRAPTGFRLRPELLPDVRSLPFRNYIIFYIPIESGIEVFRVIHGARDIPQVILDQN